MEDALSYDTPLANSPFSYEKLKIAFFFITGIAFTRIISFIVLWLIAGFCAYISLLGGKAQLWFRFWYGACAYATSWLPFTLGFYKVRVEGIFENSAPIVVSNHVCTMEEYLLFGLSGGWAFVTKAENAQLPLFSEVIRASDSIAIDKTTAEGRKKGEEDISRRVREKRAAAQPLLIYPEGTTDNANVLLQFKVGAFVPGVPVQPISFKFLYRHFNPCWIGSEYGGNDLGMMYFRMACQFVNRCDVKVMPVYYPSDKELADPKLFATNVQKCMAHFLQIAISDGSPAESYGKNKLQSSEAPQPLKTD